MNVRQLMSKDPVTVQPESTLQEAAEKMHKKNIGAVLVIENGMLKGILTDRDIALTAAAQGLDPKNTPVSQCMVPDPISIDANADIDSALRIMNRASVRRLPVMENGKVIGVISSSDLAEPLKQQFEQFIGVEEAYAGD